jgi:thioredoxin 1
MTEFAPELTNHEFDEFIKEGIVLIDFFADWCMPCMMMGPIIEELAEKMQGKVKVGKVNVGENENLAFKFNVNSIPNFTLFKDGKIKEQFTGAMTLEELEEKIKKYI